MRTWLLGLRRRTNPLCRRSDVVEAWTALLTAVLLVLGVPAAGVAAGTWAGGEARATAERQRAERHSVRAEVLGRAVESTTEPASARRPYLASVRWTGPDGRTRGATAVVPGGTRAGQSVEVWFDRTGHSVPPPPDGFSVQQYAVTVGVSGAVLAAGTLLAAHELLRRLALRRRLAEWGEEWARTEPEWSRRNRA